MKDEKGIIYVCSECGKEVRVVFIVKADKKNKQLCSKCYHKK